MKHLDLFSGIGGFALAARRVGWETVGFCETDEFCRNVIEKNFDSVRWISLPRSECRGEKIGLDRDEELVGLEPDWLVIENVYHVWQNWVPELRRELHRRGYASLPIRVSAADLGAPHIRARAFIIAHPNSEFLRELSWWWCWEGRTCAAEFAESWDYSPGAMGKNDGIPNKMDRLRSLGNAVIPQIPEIIFKGINAVEETNGNAKT